MVERKRSEALLRRATAGFTLIELLVVIAIIAILAAILFPVFAKAPRERASRQLPQQHEQMGLGIMMYAQDYDDTIIPGAWPYENPDQTINWGSPPWYTLLTPYVKGAVMVCPSTTDTIISYGWNQRGFGLSPHFPNAWETYEGNITKLAQLECVAETLLLADNQNQGSTNYRYNNVYWLELDSAYYSANSGRHMDGRTILFADGHAKWAARV